MAQGIENAEKEKQLRIRLHQTILNAKKAKVCGKTIVVHHLGDLHDITPFYEWKDDGIHNIEGTAEFFFIVENENGYISSGNRLNFNVKVKKSGDVFELEETPIINDVINTSMLKQTEDE